MPSGGTIKIQCEAAGFPEPFINWRLNWGHVCDEPRCLASNEKGLGVLTIKNARLSDSGAYSCEALNSKGRLFALPDSIVTVYDSGRNPGNYIVHKLKISNTYFIRFINYRTRL